MTYPINIVVNNRIWYDSRILEIDPVVFQNVNYATGDERSVNIVRQRFMQDWARRTIPNSVRQGIGLTDPAGAIDQIVVTQGYAVVGGRFLDIPAGTYDASDEGLTGSGGSPIDHYFMIRLTPESEADDRDPTLESASLVAVTKSSYDSAKSHDDLVLAKFRYNGSVIDQFVDYTAEQEWQANVISPPATRPGLTTATTENVLLRAGALQRVNVMNIETDKARFYLNAVFNDQDSTPIGEIKLINKDAILQTRDITDLAYLGQDMLNLLIGGTERIDSSGNLLNIGTINARTMGGNTSTDLIDTDSTQTMTNKTLTSPIITGGTLNSGGALTVDSTELNQLDAVSVGGNTSGDIITTDNTQTMTNKTLTTPVIATLYQTSPSSNLITFPSSAQTLVGITTTDTLTNKTLETLVIQDSDQTNIITFGVPNNTGDKIMTIPSTLSNIASENTFVYTDITQILKNKTLDTLAFEDNNGTGSFKFTVNTPVLIADRILSISNTIADTFVFETQTQELTNKTLGATTMSGTLAMAANAITTSSTVDGRNVSTDGTKLDTIETSATADQTKADIEGLGIQTVGAVTSGSWTATAITNTYLASVNQPLLTSSNPTFAGLNVTNHIIPNVDDGDNLGSAANKFNQLFLNGTFWYYNPPISAGTDVQWTGNQLTKVTSSIRYKENLVPYTEDSSVIYDFQPYFYNYKETKSEGLGWIAEDLDLLAPYLIHYEMIDDIKAPENYYSKHVQVLIVEELKKLRQRIIDLENK
ncbi:hypothetical protein LCGC14_0368480 [marine sediment metagenome]|uniref:Peptidase S74 domain-containing protein n=1 Tax=marine sediment metagenome TaxID=412755 RepID=A0A0F9VT48_9ZZZZ